MRDDAEHRLSRLFLQKFDSRRKERDVTAKLVDDKPLDERSFILFQKLQSADERSERTAAIDIGNEQNGRIQILRHAHVDDVVRLEIDLGRASRALNDDGFVLRIETRQRFFDRRKRFERIALVVLLRCHIADRLSHEHDLRAGVSCRLQQDGIHVDKRFKSRGFRLGDLRTPHLQTIFRDIGIERHVLRFEGDDAPPLLPKDAAERRRQDALSNMRARPHHHDVVRQKPFLLSSDAVCYSCTIFTRKVQEAKPKAQADWTTFLKGSAQCPQSGRLCV